MYVYIKTLTIIPTENKELIKCIHQCLASTSVYFEVESVKGENGYSTSIFIKARIDKLGSAQKQLTASLKENFPDLDSAFEWVVQGLEAGEDECDDSEELTPEDSAASVILRYFEQLAINSKIVSFRYKRRSVYVYLSLDIGKCTCLKDVWDRIDNAEIFDIPKDLTDRKFYYILNNNRHYINDVTCFEEGKKYSIETALDRPAPISKFSTMDEFYEILKNDKGFSEDVKNVFEEQCINYNVLMMKGQLALTDAELEKCGIKQMGLRTTILSLIESNQ